MREKIKKGRKERKEVSEKRGKRDKGGERLEGEGFTGRYF